MFVLSLLERERERKGPSSFTRWWMSAQMMLWPRAWTAADTRIYYIVLRAQHITHIFAVMIHTHISHGDVQHIEKRQDKQKSLALYYLFLDRGESNRFLELLCRSLRVCVQQQQKLRKNLLKKICQTVEWNKNRREIRAPSLLDYCKRFLFSFYEKTKTKERWAKISNKYLDAYICQTAAAAAAVASRQLRKTELSLSLGCCCCCWGYYSARVLLLYIFLTLSKIRALFPISPCPQKRQGTTVFWQFLWKHTHKKSTPPPTHPQFWYGRDAPLIYSWRKAENKPQSLWRICHMYWEKMSHVAVRFRRNQHIRDLMRDGRHVNCLVLQIYNYYNMWQ